ncbi:MAG: hypothetical protein ACRDNK_21345 [Solirubrobacteraceae bacterium]
MRIRSLFSRRPSAAMIVSTTALFVSLGGVGYAASSLPASSVGTAQLQHSSVTHSKLRWDSVRYRDIVPGSVGVVRANLGQLQARVGGTCAAGQAIGAVDQAGKVTCNPARPAEFGTTGTVTVPAAATAVASLTLPAGSSYMTFANPTATVKSTSAENVDVTCTLAVGPNTQTRTADVTTPANGTTSEVSIPLMVAGPAGSAVVSCQHATSAGSTPATVSVTSAINGLQTSSNS